MERGVPKGDECDEGECVRGLRRRLRPREGHAARWHVRARRGQVTVTAVCTQTDKMFSFYMYTSKSNSGGEKRMFVSSTFKVNQDMSRRYLSPRRPLSRLID